MMMGVQSPGVCLKAGAAFTATPLADDGNPVWAPLLSAAVDQLNTQVNSAFVLVLSKLKSLQRHGKGEGSLYTMKVEVKESDCTNNGQHKASDEACTPKQHAPVQFFQMQVLSQGGKYTLEKVESTPATPTAEFIL